MTRNNSIENVLILQGGGSLGAFGCGVFKAIAESQVKIDILAGTSIGGINAAIIAGSREKRPESALEQFWLEIAENSIDLAPSLTHLYLLVLATVSQIVTTVVTTRRWVCHLGKRCHFTARRYMVIVRCFCLDGGLSMR